MGSILVAVPDIADHQLVFNEAETRQILKFFWPQYVRQIDTLTITNDARRLAQTALIAAIDGSYDGLHRRHLPLVVEPGAQRGGIRPSARPELRPALVEVRHTRRTYEREGL